MAAAPKWKLYRSNAYVGCLKDFEDALAAVEVGIADEVRATHLVQNRRWPLREHGAPGRAPKPLTAFDSYEAAAEAALGF